MPRTRRSTKKARRETAADVADVAPPRLRLENAGTRTKAQENLVELWRDGSLCDVKIVVESQTFCAHRTVLAVESDYMRALFCGDRFKDSTAESIELVEISAASFKRILEWIYTRKCDVDESEVTDLLQAASRLQCLDLIFKLEEVVADALSADTCLGVWDAADRLQLTKLAEAAKAKTLKCYKELISTNDFKALPADKLSGLLASDELEMENEEAVFASVISWAKAQSTPPTADQLGEIFDNIRFPLMSESFINDHVASEQLMINSPRTMMALFQSMKEKVYNKVTTRTSLRRCQRKLTWEDMKEGLRVRIIDDLEAAKALCERAAPGANEKVYWDDDMSQYIGSEFTINQLVPVMRSVRGNEIRYSWPFDSLERLK